MSPYRFTRTRRSRVGVGCVDVATGCDPRTCLDASTATLSSRALSAVSSTEVPAWTDGRVSPARMRSHAERVCARSPAASLSSGDASDVAATDRRRCLVFELVLIGSCLTHKSRVRYQLSVIGIAREAPTYADHWMYSRILSAFG